MSGIFLQMMELSLPWCTQECWVVGLNSVVNKTSAGWSWIFFFILFFLTQIKKNIRTFQALNQQCCNYQHQCCWLWWTKLLIIDREAAYKDAGRTHGVFSGSPWGLRWFSSWVSAACVWLWRSCSEEERTYAALEQAEGGLPVHLPRDFAPDTGSQQLWCVCVCVSGQCHFPIHQQYIALGAAGQSGVNAIPARKPE